MSKARRRHVVVSYVVLLVATAIVVVAVQRTHDQEPPPQQAAASAFPNADVTGVPAGTTLSEYRGPCTISETGTVIDAVDVRCEPLTIAAKGVVIRSSRVGPVDVDGPEYSVTIEDSNVDAGGFSGAAVGYSNFTVRRSEIVGGQHSAVCSNRCLIEDSWLHDQALPADEARHNNAVLSNGGTDLVLRGNTLACTPSDNAVDGGCSGDVSLFGDFAPVKNVTVDGNLFQATPGAFCLRLGLDEKKDFGSETTGVTVTNNVFERGQAGACGTEGTVTSAPPDLVWSDNRFEDGETVTQE